MKERRGWRYGLLVLGLAVLALMVMDFNGRMAELRRLTMEREDVSLRVTQQVQTQSALNAQIAYATSEGAVREWAYQDAHMAREGDFPVVPVSPSDSTPTPTPAPTVVPVKVSNLERWIALFLGPSAP